MVQKVLIVDDSELIHTYYRLIMKKYRDCELIKAMNGKEALDRLTVEKDIELILLDINMPIMNGIQFLEAVHKTTQYSNIPIIVISTEGKEDDLLKALGLGAKGYLVKPFRTDNLHHMIQSVLKDTQEACAQ